MGTYVIKDRKQFIDVMMSIIMYVVGAFVVSYAFQILLAYLLQSPNINEDMQMIFIITIPSFIGFILFPLLIIKIMKTITYKELGVHNKLNQLGILILTISSVVICFTLISKGTTSVWLMLHFAVIGYGEELLFRGFMFGQLLKVVKPILAILISSLVFAVVFHSGAPFLENITVRLLLGIIFSVMFYYTRSVWVVGTFHWAYNYSLILF